MAKKKKPVKALKAVKNTEVTELKSLSYALNAKPDTEIRLFQENKRITRDNIIEINDLVLEKLNTEPTYGEIITSTVLQLSEKKVLDFGRWESFIEKDLNISNKVQSVSIKWDFLLNLPGYKIPQRHTLRLRLGSQIRPNEIIHIVLESENDSEIDEMSANAVCKVDFISDVISAELLGVIERWHAALPTSDSFSLLEKFLHKKAREISDFLDYFSYVVGIAVIILISNLSFVEEQILNDLPNLFKFAGFSIIFIVMVRFFGGVFSIYLYKKMRTIKHYPIFLVTRGDANKFEEVKTKNKHLVREIIIGLASNILSALVLWALSLNQFVKDLNL